MKYYYKIYYDSWNNCYTHDMTDTWDILYSEDSKTSALRGNCDLNGKLVFSTDEVYLKDEGGCCININVYNVDHLIRITEKDAFLEII